MKTLKTAALLAITGAAFIAQPAQAGSAAKLLAEFVSKGIQLAQAPAPLKAATTATNPAQLGDLFLAFRQDGGSNSYALDIGPASLYTAGNSFTVTNLTVNGIALGAIASDLGTAFGTAWPAAASLSTIHWSVSGTNLTGDPISDGDSTTYQTKPQNPFGTHPAPYAALNATNLGNANTNMSTMFAGYNGADSATSSWNITAAGGVILPSSAANSYPQFGANGFGVFPGMEGLFTNGTANQALDLFRSAPNLTAVREGTFTINDSGVVTYQAVPEPASVALIAAGAGLLGLSRFRRKLKSA